MYRIVIIMICASLESVAQMNIPNGGFNQFETIRNERHTYSLPVGWKEHQKNELLRSRDGHGFAYKYDLPDANESAIALHRGSSPSHLTEENAIFLTTPAPQKCKNLRLVGRYKFSGSDIETATDTLKVIVFSTPEKPKNLPKKFPEDATVLDLVVPRSQFEWFHLDMNEIEKGNFLTIVIQLKSGSDDSYYWGYANAVIDDLELTAKRNL